MIAPTELKLSPRRVFIQYLNPEILLLYGIKKKSRRFRQNILLLTKYAFLVSDSFLIIPVSYLFEVPLVDYLYEQLSTSQIGNLICYASPTSNLEEYAQKKKKEYREEPYLFPSYFQKENDLLKNRNFLQWIPRINRSSSQDIGSAWVEELGMNFGIWESILKNNKPKHYKRISKLETTIEKIPNLLEGKAFIFRYAKPLLPVKLELQDETKISMLISRAYLESYLDEFDALVLADTPLGLLDCGLSPIGLNGHVRKVSLRYLSTFLDNIGLYSSVINCLHWNQIIALRQQPIFQWFIEWAIRDSLDSQHQFINTIIRSGYKFSLRPIIPRNDSIIKICELLYTLHAKVEPFLPTQKKTINLPLNFSDNGLFCICNQSDICRREILMEKNKVFLVYGRDLNAYNSMKALLRSVNITPVDWEEAVKWTGKTSPYIMDVLREAFLNIQAVIIIFTPDEKVELRKELSKDANIEDGWQPRPNVLIEAGMAFAWYPERTIIVKIGDIRCISDLEGLHYLNFDGSAQSRYKLIKRLEIAGCSPKTDASDFLGIGFEYLNRVV